MAHYFRHHDTIDIFISLLLLIMNEYLFIFLFIVWYVLSLVVAEKIGKKRKIGEEWSFFISFMLSPAIGLIASMITKRR